MVVWSHPYPGWTRRWIRGYCPRFRRELSDPQLIANRLDVVLKTGARAHQRFQELLILENFPRHVAQGPLGAGVNVHDLLVR
jgi:hypothetical protein